MPESAKGAVTPASIRGASHAKIRASAPALRAQDRETAVTLNMLNKGALLQDYTQPIQRLDAKAAASQGEDFSTTCIHHPSIRRLSDAA